MSRSFKKNAIVKIGCKGYREILNRKFRRRKGEDTVVKKNEGYLVRDYWSLFSKKRYSDDDIAKARRK